MVAAQPTSTASPELLKQRLRGTLVEMVTAMLTEKPDNAVAFIESWSQQKMDQQRELDTRLEEFRYLIRRYVDHYKGVSDGCHHRHMLALEDSIFDQKYIQRTSEEAKSARADCLRAYEDRRKLEAQIAAIVRADNPSTVVTAEQVAELNALYDSVCEMWAVATWSSHEY